MPEEIHSPPPSLPPTGEGLPEEIVKAIDRFAEASRHEGGVVEGATEEGLAQAERNANSAYLALDATILRHLSAARARAERAEKALEAAGQAADAMESVSKRLPAYSSPAELLLLHALKVRAALSSVAEPKGA